MRKAVLVTRKNNRVHSAGHKGLRAHHIAAVNDCFTNLFGLHCVLRRLEDFSPKVIFKCQPRISKSGSYTARHPVFLPPGCSSSPHPLAGRERNFQGRTEGMAAGAHSMPSQTTARCQAFPHCLMKPLGPVYMSDSRCPIPAKKQ